MTPEHWSKARLLYRRSSSWKTALPFGLKRFSSSPNISVTVSLPFTCSLAFYPSRLRTAPHARSCLESQLSIFSTVAALVPVGLSLFRLNKSPYPDIVRWSFISRLQLIHPAVDSSFGMLARLPSVPVDSFEADMLEDGFLDGWTREGVGRV